MKYDVDEDNKYNDLQCVYIYSVYMNKYIDYTSFNMYITVYLNFSNSRCYSPIPRPTCLGPAIPNQATHCLKDHVPHLPSKSEIYSIHRIGGRSYYDCKIEICRYKHKKIHYNTCFFLRG